MNDIVKSDVLIIGTGIAGCCSALKLAEEKLNVTIITKMSDPQESNSNYAQGGIVGKVKNDSPELLAKDIYIAGAYLGNDKAIKMLSEEGPQMVPDFLINKVGVNFSKNKNDSMHYTSEGAHSKRRIYHSMDHTGRNIEEKLIEKVKQNKYITLIPNQMAIDLITTRHHSKDKLSVYYTNECLGAYVFDSVDNKVRMFFAKKTILATGGLGNIFLYTSNPCCSTGDGLAMAYRAGANIINAEYIQFHPTTLFHRDSNRFLITESLRGEGAKLKNLKGEYFMKNYDKRKDLAPRDIVSRAIYEELLKTEKGYVFLDLSDVIKQGVNIEQRFPTIYKKCKRLGIDMNNDLIPIVPAAHYFCGGIQVNLNGESNLKNLYAVGEVSCTGLHGANRLASVSLLEAVVWGVKSAEHISKFIDNHDNTIHYTKVSQWKGVNGYENVDPVLILQDWLTIKTTMWNYTGIVRTKKRLLRANADLNYLSHRIEKFYKESSLTKELIELRNGIIASLIIVKAALKNEESIGCHFRKN